MPARQALKGSGLKAWAWWLGLLVLAPVALPLALHTRRHALRLPPAAGPQQGVAGAQFVAKPLRLLLLGESTIAGVGVASQADALAGQLAAALAVRCGRPVHWQALGENGITAAQAQQRLLPQVLRQPVDLAVLALGVNDSSHLSSLHSWCQAQAGMAQALQQQGARVAFCAVPPLEHFTALPWLLRRLLGARARLLDGCLGRVAGQLGASHHPLQLEFTAEFLAEDGYHPSVLGYRVWAQALAAELGLEELR
ncbi:SGNH/GDSL hydrolase family protein [Pseudomonas sp. 5P_3.1_Bac2]|uniref:SGNH/GDSL hydrolase family protein n=1 Tax=Pseudomonas sp. 5P_3.1_Bac2 TaxID=2971617 RepID=UPI0021C70439|nr:SGNH/GDSL hydrolase family protein [Pseudomonas sp. 5P_3.1_Bac2]MCU1719606.1 SGNH/GDSL hydrolase family protein [Pseudomonas sp. 5P_3.1_Bac2]